MQNVPSKFYNEPANRLQEKVFSRQGAKNARSFARFPICLGPGFLYQLCCNHPSSSNRATALAMLDVVTPTFRPILAIDNPNSSTPRVAVPARAVLTLLRRQPPLSSLPLIPPLLHSSPIILLKFLSVLRSFSSPLVFSSASLRMASPKSLFPSKPSWWEDGTFGEDGTSYIPPVKRKIFSCDYTGTKDR